MRWIGNISVKVPTWVRRSLALLVCCAATWLLAEPVEADIAIRFDYTYDTSGFFAEGSEARETLQWVGEFYGSLLNDDFLAIDSAEDNHFDIQFWQPDTEEFMTVEDYDVSADTMVIFVGAKEMGSAALAWGGHGFYSASGASDWLEDVATRGEGTSSQVEGYDATEVAIWGGSVSVNSGTDWNENHTTLPDSGEYNLASVLLHEVAHVLGFGTADSWENSTDHIDQFIGPVTVAANQRNSVPLQPDLGHWQDEATNSTVFGTDVYQQAIMEPYMARGMNLWASLLDIAALDDIGWDINPIDVWQGASGGIFSSSANWSTGVSPGVRDSVRFDRSGTCRVSFIQDAKLQQISCEVGQVTFALEGNSVTTNLLWATGNGTSLCIEAGTLQVDVYAMVDANSSISVGLAGSLKLGGSTFDGDLTIDAGGELAGQGILTGTLSNQAGGTVSPGGSGEVGWLEVENYYQADDAVFEVDLFSLNDYDSLAVDGNATLAGELMIHVESSMTLAEMDAFTILSCTELNGQFDSISGDRSLGQFEWNVVYDYTANTVSLVLHAAFLPGDANKDGIVDGSDVIVIAGNWQAGVVGGGATWEMGDFNGDGKVDGSDVTILASNWQRGTASGTVVVPEPSTVVLLGFLIVGVLIWFGMCRWSSADRLPRRVRN